MSQILDSGWLLSKQDQAATVRKEEEENGGKMSTAEPPVQRWLWREVEDRDWWKGNICSFLS